MSPETFVHWFSGYLDACGEAGPSAGQFKAIREKLKTVSVWAQALPYISEYKPPKVMPLGLGPGDTK